MHLKTLLKPLVEKLPWFANKYREWRDSRNSRKVVKYQDRLGYKFNGTEAMNSGTFEPDETQIFDRLIAHFDLFVNIGANVGYYACRALHRGTDVLAFEPNQLNVNALLKNVNANSFDASFTVFPVALSDRSGILPLYGASTGASLIEGWAGQKAQKLVPVVTFDHTVEAAVTNRSCFVLIDIEGAELACLRGARALLDSDTDNVFLIEITVSVHQPSGVLINPFLVQTFELMDSYGYSAYTANGDLREVSVSEVARIFDTNENTLGTYNFLFTRTLVWLKELRRH